MGDLPTLLRRKLDDALQTADAHTEAAIRDVWKTIGPQPHCPFVTDVMRQLQSICAKGLTERERVALDVVSTTVLPFKETLNRELLERLGKVVESAFPLDKFVSLVEHTPDVYRRRQAPARKFDQNSYEHRLTLIKASAANVPRRSIRRAKLVLDEMMLQNETARGPMWRRVSSAVWRGLAKPTVRWTFGIVAAVLTAWALKYLGVAP